MGVVRFTQDEGFVFYEDPEGNYEVDLPDELYRKWRDAGEALAHAEDEIDALYRAQHPRPISVPRDPDPVLAEPTAPVPPPRTLADYQRGTT